MNRSICSFALFLATCSAVPAAERATVFLPAGTPINMYVPGDVNAQSVRAGDSFRAQAASDVIVDGMVVVRKGAEGQGTIGELQRSGANLPQNALALTFDWVYATDGSKIRLSQTDSQHAGRAVPRSALLSNAAVFGMAGFFGFVNAFSDGNVRVAGAARSAP